MSAAGSEGRTVAAPRLALLIPTDGVGIALVTENTAENHIMFDALDLEATFGQVAAGFELCVLSAHFTTFPLLLPF
jgi:hypothetical protein